MSSINIRKGSYGAWHIQPRGHYVQVQFITVSSWSHQHGYHLNSVFFHSLATDIVEARLELAKKVGADVTINCKTENLKDAGTCACNSHGGKCANTNGRGGVVPVIGQY